MTFGFRGGLSYISRLWYMDGKIRWQGWATGNLFKIRHPRAMFPPYVNLNGGGKWMFLSGSHALFLCLFIPILFSERTSPAVFSIRPGKGGSLGWIRSPSLSSLMPCATKSHCLQRRWGRWGSTCKSACFYSFLPQNSSKEINRRLLPSEGRQLPALAWLNIQTQLAAHMTARAVRDAQFVPEGPPLIVEAAPPE